jgi:hypothetical protein
MALNLSARRWQDMLILVLGLWLVASPWVLGYASNSPHAMNAYIVGTAVAVLAAFDLYRTYMWAVVANLLMGAWITVSPWVPALTDRGAMMTNSVIVGAAVVVLALWELRSDPELHRQWAGS